MCFVQLFKFFLHLGLLGTRMQIGMILACETPEGLLDVVSRSRAGQAEDLIIVARCRRHGGGLSLLDVNRYAYPIIDIGLRTPLMSLRSQCSLCKQPTRHPGR